MKKYTLAVLLALFTTLTFAQDLSYYLPKGYTYNPSIPTPKQVLGYEVGEWHVTHDQLVMYMKAVAEKSDRVIFEETGRFRQNIVETCLFHREAISHLLFLDA